LIEPLSGIVGTILVYQYLLPLIPAFVYMRVVQLQCRNTPHCKPHLTTETGAEISPHVDKVVRSQLDRDKIRKQDGVFLYNQIQRKFMESCESSTTSNEMVNSIEYLSILRKFSLSIMLCQFIFINTINNNSLNIKLLFGIISYLLKRRKKRKNNFFV
jgi:hypothetical protein